MVGIGGGSVAGASGKDALSFHIVLEGQRTVGRALHKRCYPRGNGVGTLPFHLRFGELMNLAVFPLAKLEWTSTTGKGT